MNQQQCANNNDQALMAEKTCINEKCKRTKGNHANKNSKEIRWRKSKGETKNLKRGRSIRFERSHARERDEFFLSSNARLRLQKHEKTDQLSIFYP